MSERVLDACCGSKMFWFDKDNKDVVFMDNRELETNLCDGRTLKVSPDIVADFRSIPFLDESFYMVVFDPPHLRNAGENSWLKAKYGLLTDNWKDDIQQGFKECLRVLKPNGTLIFKWNEDQISLGDIKPLMPIKPLVGQRRGKTIWLVFMK